MLRKIQVFPNGCLRLSSLMKKRVAIIGGGISGLVAASFLVRNNVAVTVFEAKERFGGRINAIRHDSMPIELGAEFLHGRSKTILNAIRAAKLSTHEVPDRNRVLEDGRFRSFDIWGTMEKLIHRVDSKKPDCSFSEFLERQRLNEQTRKMAMTFVQGFHAAHPDRISMHGLLRGQYSAEQMDGSSQERINEGYSALVKFMEEDIRQRGATLLTNAEVQAVRWSHGKVEIVRRERSSRSAKSGSGQHAFDAALITLPLGVLKSRAVKFDPPLSAKREAINGLEFGSVVKVAMVFGEQWWPDDFGFVHAVDAAIPTWWTDPRGPVLTGWVGGPKADALAKHAPTDLEGLCLKILQKFTKRPLALRARLAASYSYNWRSDPHVRGAYSYIPVNGLDLPKLLAAPLADTLFFAGEATVGDAQMGTVFGAYESGLRAAREMMD
jgi:monoamine oxidase